MGQPIQTDFSHFQLMGDKSNPYKIYHKICSQIIEYDNGNNFVCMNNLCPGSWTMEQITKMDQKDFNEHFYSMSAINKNEPIYKLYFDGTLGCTLSRELTEEEYILYNKKHEI